MRHLPEKLAADDQIEGAFFQLAYQKLQDTLKNLIPYLIGFEIIKKSEDNTRALGLFGFRSNNGQILYVPAFFMNGKVKPLDLLYSKNNEQFYPLNEDFAEMFIKSELTGLGDTAGESRTTLMRDMAQGDFRQMAVPPRTGKTAIASVVDYVKTASDKTKTAFMDLLEKDAEFLESVMRFYPLEKVAEALVTTSESTDKSDKATQKVKVVKKKDPAAAKLTDSKKKTLLNQGYVIVDDRKPDEKSQFGVMQGLNKFITPDETGFYSYISKAGTLHHGLVLVRPSQLQQDFAIDDSFVIDLEDTDGTTYVVDSTKLVAKDKFKVDDYSTVHKLMVDPAEAKAGWSDVYVLINEQLKATQPFRINANFKDAEGIRRIDVSPWSSYDFRDLRGPQDRPGSVHDLPRGNYYEHPKKHSTIFLVLTKRSGDRLAYRDGMVYVPAGYKLLQIKPYDDQRNECWPCPNGKADEKARKEREERNARKAAAAPGSARDVTRMLTDKHVFPMGVHTNGSEYFVDIAGAKKKYEDPISAKIGMVLDYGLDEKQAAELIDSLIPGFKKEGHLKMAFTGDMYPTPFEENPYANELGQPTTSGMGVETMLPQTDSYTGNPTQQGLGTMPEIQGVDPAYVQHAIQLAANGQKEIFDAHMLGTLAKYVGVGDKITEYLPSLVEAMDRLGRLLFLLHWETDKFKEMYGRGDLPQLVELLTNVLKNMGDLVIFLKRKSPELSINMTKQDALEL